MDNHLSNDVGHIAPRNSQDRCVVLENPVCLAISIPTPETISSYLRTGTSTALIIMSSSNSHACEMHIDASDSAL
jgi:hypothetical protein